MSKNRSFVLACVYAFTLGLAWLILASLCGCEQSDVRLDGVYEYQSGEGNWNCDDGWQGRLSINEGAMARIVSVEDGLLYKDGGRCPDGFLYKLGDEDGEGWIAQNERCHYDDRGSHVTAIRTSKSWMKFDEYGNLTDRQQWQYIFSSESGYLHCNVFSLSHAKKVGE